MIVDKLSVIINSYDEQSTKYIISQFITLFSKHWLIRHRYRSGMRRMLDTDLLA